MYAIGRKVLLCLSLALSCSVVHAKDPLKADLTRRQDEILNKRAPVEIQQPRVVEGFTDQRFPITRWHAKFSPLGARRAPITMGETREKRMVQPQIIPMDQIGHRRAPQDGRMAAVRNFSEVRENRLVPSLRDAEVVRVGEVSRPAMGGKEREVSMRDINRFTFHRNQYEDEPAPVQRAGSGAGEDSR